MLFISSYMCLFAQISVRFDFNHCWLFPLQIMPSVLPVITWEQFFMCSSAFFTPSSKHFPLRHWSSLDLMQHWYPVVEYFLFLCVTKQPMCIKGCSVTSTEGLSVPFLHHRSMLSTGFVICLSRFFFMCYAQCCHGHGSGLRHVHISIMAICSTIRLLCWY